MKEQIVLHVLGGPWYVGSGTLQGHHPARPARGRQVLLGRAIVLGGSIAGLMAARVLGDHADEVLIVERDDLAALDVSDNELARDPTAVSPPRGLAFRRFVLISQARGGASRMTDPRGGT